MAQPTIMIIPTEYAETMSAVLEAMGMGPGTFTNRPLCRITDSIVITHWIAQDMGASAEYAIQLRAMAEYQTLPEITGTWGVNGVPSALIAQEAMSHFVVLTAAGNVDIDPIRQNLMDSMGLMFWEEPEIE